MQYPQPRQAKYSQTNGQRNKNKPPALQCTGRQHLRNQGRGGYDYSHGQYTRLRLLLFQYSSPWEEAVYPCHLAFCTRSVPNISRPMLLLLLLLLSTSTRDKPLLTRSQPQTPQNGEAATRIVQQIHLAAALATRPEIRPVSRKKASRRPLVSDCLRTNTPCSFKLYPGPAQGRPEFERSCRQFISQDHPLKTFQDNL